MGFREPVREKQGLLRFQSSLSLSQTRRVDFFPLWFFTLTPTASSFFFTPTCSLRSVYCCTAATTVVTTTTTTYTAIAGRPVHLLPGINHNRRVDRQQRANKALLSPALSIDRSRTALLLAAPRRKGRKELHCCCSYGGRHRERGSRDRRRKRHREQKKQALADLLNRFIE